MVVFPGAVAECLYRHQPSRQVLQFAGRKYRRLQQRGRPCADIGVREVKIPDYLDKPQIATLKSGGVEVDISELNRWSESLSTMIQRVVADDLGYNLPKAVVKPRVSAREDFKYLLQIEIGQLDGSWNKTANLEAWWSIADASGNLLVQQKSSLSVPLGNGYDDLVRAESRLLAELSAQIAPAFARLK